MSDKKAMIDELAQITKYNNQKEHLMEQLRDFAEKQPNHASDLKEKLQDYQNSQWNKLTVPQLPTIYTNVYKNYTAERLPLGKAIFVMAWTLVGVIMLMRWIGIISEIAFPVYLLFFGGAFLTVCFFEGGSLGEYSDWEKGDRKWHERTVSTNHNAENQAFFEQCVAFDEAYAKLVEECKEKRRESLDEFFSTEQSRKKKFLETKTLLQEKILAIEEKLKDTNLLHKDYHHLSNDIARMLKTGRADCVKEGLNLVLEEHARKAAWKDRRNAELRAQQQATAEQARKDAAYREAERKYKAAAARYSSWAARGNTRNALDAKRDMELALAEMHRNS